MTEYLIILVFVLWYVLALVVSERMGKNRKIGTEWSFFISIIFSPLIGYLITRFSPEK
jgi:hypothetical protein